MSGILSGILLFLLTWVVNAAALAAVGALVPGVRITSIRGAAFGALALGVVTWLFKPVLILFSAPLLLLTLGVFYLVILTICFSVAGWMTRDFEIDGFGSAFLGALVLSVVNWVLGLVIPGVGWW